MTIVLNKTLLVNDLRFYRRFGKNFLAIYRLFFSLLSNAINSKGGQFNGILR